jgi:hypothetical protein
MYPLVLFLGVVFCSNPAEFTLEGLSARLEAVQSALTQQLDQRSLLLHQISELMANADRAVKRPRQVEYRIPLGMGEKIESFERLQANLQGISPPCPAGFYLSPFREGNSICVQSGRHPTSDVVRFEGFQPDCFMAWNKILQRTGTCDVMVDVGANIGACSLLGGIAGFRVLAVEPDVSLRAAISATIIRNSLSHRIFLSDAVVGTTHQLSHIVGSMPCVRFLNVNCAGCELAGIEDLYQAGKLSGVDTVKVRIVSPDVAAKVAAILAIDRDLFFVSITGELLAVDSVDQIIRHLLADGVLYLFAFSRISS